MMKTKILLIIITGLFLIQWTCTTGEPKPPYVVNLPVPFHQQECGNWCGIACIQMWADFDGWLVTQAEIASYLGIVGNLYASPYDLERGVGAYTASPGWLERREWDEPGGQGELVAASITGIKYGVPSIMPFGGGTHAVLIKGYEWREEDDIPIALACWYHDPNGIVNRKISAAQLSNYFDCFPADYWVIVGDYDFVLEGINGHFAFIAAGGTYYGGPQTYDPFVFQE
ncbi:MAG: hypothetical protein GTO45_29330 [Candidatus Aminicenantes bacterium]|nr:hypothetical protein [Candidatus Aminicenantes bacterium]NIM82896.1 hypothetical protein [Candidatus Aminicenantes bacterium]NIN22272.1 hypothetical protein [Candidatus Aminicenantes bacterium]NIN46040.1 hypothetical protein [Candidatus Aminicenantes bacterium]NIN88876.1 hypothetical protein [Candidatus Aminicenantes bacterium]